MKDLIEAMDKKKLKIVFGLEAQGHIPTIENILKKWNNGDIKVDMTYTKEVWEEVGKKIGWCPFVAALSYFEHKEKSHLKWYDKDGVFSWLKGRDYSDEIANELSDLIAENMQLAYDKGKSHSHRD